MFVSEKVFSRCVEAYVKGVAEVQSEMATARQRTLARRHMHEYTVTFTRKDETLPDLTETLSYKMLASDAADAAGKARAAMYQNVASWIVSHYRLSEIREVGDRTPSTKPVQNAHNGDTARGNA